MEPHEFQALANYLPRHIPGFAGLVDSKRFSGGQSNPTYLLTAASGRYVLRRKPRGAILPSAHAIDREYRLLQALQPTAVPVATPLHYCHDAGVIGAEFYVMDFLDGVLHWDPALPDLAGALRRPATLAMVDALAALHRVDWQAAGLADFGKPGDYAARQIARWSRQFRATQDGSYPQMERLIARLQANLPVDDGRATLVHGDYRIDNLMYQRDSADVMAVLDWELATIGHPFADLAYMLMHHRLPNDGVFHGLGGIDREARSLPSADDITARYARGIGADRIDNLDFWISLAAFRLAAILEGVRARIEAGNASDPDRGRRLVATIPDLIEMGLNPALSAP